MRAFGRAALRCAWISLCLAVADAGPAVAQPVQSHSMIHLCCTPYDEQEDIITAAKASGAGMVRLDVELQGIVGPSPYGYLSDFSKLDRLLALARRTGIRILAVLNGTPAGMTACPAGTDFESSWKCPPEDPQAYARHAVAVMEHAGAGVFAWEFWNEPDLSYMYLGTPEQYGHTLRAISQRARGRFRITNGGVAGLRTGLPFLRRAIAAGARFSIGNIHLRGSQLRRRARVASRFFGRRPLWVTEHGYPSEPDPQAQVRYLTHSIPALRAGGADQIFVTLRDVDEFGPDSPFASEGIRGKPAWDLIQSLNATRPSAASAVQHGAPDYGVLDRCHWTETPDVCTQRMQALGRAGVRVVFNVRSSEDPLPDQQAFAAAAADAGLGVMWSLSDPAIYRAWAEGGDALSRVPYMTHFARDCEGCDNDRLLARAIGFWRSLPNTYGYYVADDTALNPATDPAMRALSGRVRALDSDHPTHVATFSTYDAGGAQAERYQSSADLVLAELYPWHLPGWRADEPLRAMGDRAADAQRVADAHGAESAFWLQSFTWADNDTSADAVGAHCPDDWAAERCYARGHWPSAAELTELRDQVLLNARPELIMWYYLDDIIGFVDGQRPREGRWWGPTPEQAEQRWAAFTQMLHAPPPGPRGRIAGRSRPRSRLVDVRASGVEAPGGLRRIVWRVGRQRRTGAHLHLRLPPGRSVVRLYALDGWGEFRLVDRRRVVV